MESPKTPCASFLEGDMSGVTSRSGRVIKKSTKLMDFTSPDDIEKIKAKKIAAASKKLNMTQLSHIKIEPELQLTSLDHYDVEGYSIKDHTPDDSFAPEDEYDPNQDEDFNESDSDEHQMVIKTEDDPEIEFSTPRRSIYITEKSSKKKIVKDGKIVITKAQRKDKGKTRYTAYMLWAKEARNQISNTHPELDFASVSKRLGEMWANVPTNVKYNWKRRAKRLANKMKKSNGVKGPPQPSKYMQQKYYLNKTSTNNNAGTSANAVLTKQQKQLQKLIKSEKSKTQSIQNTQKLQKERQYTLTPASISTPVKVTTMVPSTSSAVQRSISAISSRPMDLAPIDVAAHLKLLGESLINIGERLSQHEGQIAVSGSFSVLLDSILCAMSALVCCLNYVPELNFQNDPPMTSNFQTSDDTDEELRNLFHSIMDNVHYIMPGM